MMTTSTRLKPVQGFAERKERDAALVFGDAQRQVQTESEKLEQLREYHREYLERFHKAAVAGIQAARMIEFRAFLAKLEQAIAEQEKVLGSARDLNHRAKLAWQEKQSRSKAIGKVVDNHRYQEYRQQEKKEQTEQDERNQHLKPMH